MTKNFKDEFSQFKVFQRSTSGIDTKLEALPQVYSLPKRAPNVSFYAQQRRSTYLAKKMLDKHKDKRVLIVGGGLSGTTCFFSLKALGHESVTLVEAGKELIWVQSQAGHRYGHPSLAEWPTADIFSSTTNLPLMNWNAGSMTSIINEIREDPAFKSGYDKWRGSIHFDINVVGFKQKIEKENGPMHWNVQIENYSRNNANLNNFHNDYDVIILANGFGIEFGAPDTNSEYWDYDFIERISRDRRKYGKRTPLVIGGGDAALIDAARLCIGELAEEFSLELIYSLRHAGYQKFDCKKKKCEQSDVEKRLMNWYQGNSSSLSNIIPTENSSLKRIKNSRQKAGVDNTPEITLVSESSPFEGERHAVAINLILCELLSESDGENMRIKWEKGRADFEARKVFIDSSSNNISFNDNQHVIVFRCGSKDELAKFFNTADGTEIIVGNSNEYPGVTIEKETSRKITYGCLINDDEYENLSREEMIDKYQLSLIKQYAAKVFGKTEEELNGLEFLVKNENNIVTIPVSFNTDLEKCRKLGGVDYSIFGVNLNYINTDVPQNSCPSFNENDFHTGSARK